MSPEVDRDMSKRFDTRRCLMIFFTEHEKGRFNQRTRRAMLHYEDGKSAAPV